MTFISYYLYVPRYLDVMIPKSPSLLNLYTFRCYFNFYNYFYHTLIQQVLSQQTILTFFFFNRLALESIFNTSRHCFLAVLYIHSIT